MNLQSLLERHARSAVVMALALALAGVATAFNLPVDLFPQVSFPRVVDLDAGSRPANQMELLVTRPVEQAVRGVPGVQDVRSRPSRGTAQISIDFGWGRDMTASTLLITTAVQQVLPNLPSDYGVRRMDPTVLPIISYPLTTTRLSPVELRDLAQLQIVPLLSAFPGLARVDVQGGDTAEVQVLAEPNWLASYGLAISELAAALSAGNVLQLAGAGSRQAVPRPGRPQPGERGCRWPGGGPGRRGGPGPRERRRDRSGRGGAAIHRRGGRRQSRRAVQRLRTARRQCGAGGADGTRQARRAERNLQWQYADHDHRGRLPGRT